MQVQYTVFIVNDGVFINFHLLKILIDSHFYQSEYFLWDNKLDGCKEACKPSLIWGRQAYKNLKANIRK